MVHLQWSSERGPGTCPDCDGETALLSNGSGFMEPASESPFAEQLADGVETGIELTCHWCPECRKVTSVAVNL